MLDDGAKAAAGVFVQLSCGASCVRDGVIGSDENLGSVEGIVEFEHQAIPETRAMARQAATESAHEKIRRPMIKLRWRILRRFMAR